METLDPRGTPGLVPRLELFVTSLMFVCSLGHVETILHRLQSSSSVFFFVSRVISLSFI